MSFSMLIGSSFTSELFPCKRRSTKSNGFAFNGIRRLQTGVLSLSALASILFSVVSVHAATYTVKAGGGGNYTTIQACATAMAAGDTCTVYAGTYNEHPTVTSGTSGNLKTITVNPGDTVYVLGFSISSYDVINGFQIQNTSSPTTACVSIASSSSYSTVSNNVMYACGGLNEGTGGASSHITISGNTLSYADCTSSAPNTGPGFTIYGNYELIENNNISHVSDGMHFAGSHNIVRGNTMHDTLISECGSNAGNCHIDFIEAEPALASQYNVYEANTELNNTGANGHGYLTQADICNGNCYNTIIRFNTGAHVGGGGIIDDNATSSSPGYSNIKSYNNTWVDYMSAGTLYGSSDTFSHNSTHGAEINNLWYFPESITNSNPYSTDSSTAATFSSGNNLAYCTLSPCTLHGKIYGSGNWTDDPGNIFGNPLFVDYSTNNFALGSGSPAIAAGTHLTTVASGDSGSGTSLVVTDASYFQDGYGIAGVDADCIAVTTTTNHVCVVAVNYSTNTLTLASSITRSAGDSVWLYSDSSGDQVLTGNAPNIGASFGSSSSSGKSPPPPTGVTNTVIIQ